MEDLIRELSEFFVCDELKSKDIAMMMEFVKKFRDRDSAALISALNCLRTEVARCENYDMRFYYEDETGWNINKELTAKIYAGLALQRYEKEDEDASTGQDS